MDEPEVQEKKKTESKDGAMVRKTFFIDRDVEQQLRDDAHQRRKSEAEIVRELLREHLRRRRR